MTDTPHSTTGRSGLRNGDPFQVSVEFLSDWSCGTGTARHGAVDREVRRDPDGLPMLGGKALAANLRDRAETVAAGLDEGTHGLWHQWLEVIFGGQRRTEDLDEGQPPLVAGAAPGRSGPVPASLRARPLRLPTPVRAAIARLDERSRLLVAEATVLLRPGVQIDPKTGVAADDTYRIEERASAGLTLTADWQLTFEAVAPDGPIPWEAELLLLAAAKLVDAIGGKRRRGAGRCRVAIAVPGSCSADRLGALLDQIDAARSPSQLAIRAGGKSRSPGARPPVEPLGSRSIDPLHLRCQLRITALTPLLVGRGAIGNLVLTEQFVPGTSLLPAVAAALGSHATELITGGRVVVTAATVEIDGQRSLPLPHALHAEPGAAPSTLVNRLWVGGDDDRRLKARGGYCVIAGEGLRLGEPTLIARPHAVVDDQQQRPNERSGGLYVYQAIAAGTVLRAEVWLPDGVTLDRELLAGERGIGMSKKDDYGQVCIEVLDPPPAPAHLPRPDDRASELVVWLLSDLLLRGDAGQPSADVARLATALGETLGVTLTQPDPTGEAREAPAAMITTRRVESWQSRWSLPRPSLTGLAAGSVARFLMDGEPAPDAYRRLLARGLGERTAEGYGRLALQPALLRRASVTVLPPAEMDPTPPPSSTWQDQPIVAELLVRGWRRELHRCARVQAHDPQVRRKLVPPNATAAQLGTLQTLADRLAADGDPTPALAWLNGTVRVRRRNQAWNAGDPGRLDRLRRLFSGDHDELWHLLDVDPPAAAAEQLATPALAWLLAEAARTKTKEIQEVPA